MISSFFFKSMLLKFTWVKIGDCGIFFFPFYNFSIVFLFFKLGGEWKNENTLLIEILFQFLFWIVYREGKSNEFLVN